jgi:hypothetical protein
MEQNEDNPTQHSLKLVWNSLDIHPFLVVLIFTCFLDLFGLIFTSLLVASQHLNMSRQYIFFCPLFVLVKSETIQFSLTRRQRKQPGHIFPGKKTCSPSFLPKKLLEVSSGANHLSCTLLARTSQASGSHHTTGC